MPVVSSHVEVRRVGRLGRITLNRPEALNALTLGMVRSIDRGLTELEEADVSTVLIDGAGARGFCAGGDIRAIYEAIVAGDPSPLRFWREEYRLNARLARYPKPVVAVMDGIVMGGGVGLAGHASVRVATDHLTLSMPEVGIGFFPDVGATWLLSRAPGQLGTHVALTAARLDARDAIACGLADHVMARSSVPQFVDALAQGDVAELVEDREPDGASGTLAGARAWIDECYAGSSIDEIVARLRGSGVAAARQAADDLESKSPTSLRVTLEALRRAVGLPTLEACLEMEYGIAGHFLGVPDFAEGIRAAIIDKTRRPRWRPGLPEEVTDRDVAAFFASPSDGSTDESIRLFG